MFSCLDVCSFILLAHCFGASVVCPSNASIRAAFSCRSFSWLFGIIRSSES